MPDLDTTDGVRLHWEATGSPDAPPLLLLHGLGSDAEAFVGVAAAVGDRLHLVRPARTTSPCGRAVRPWPTPCSSTTSSSSPLTQPTLVVERRGDPLHPFEKAEAYAARLPDCRLVEDAEATPLDQRPADLAGLLVGFAE